MTVTLSDIEGRPGASFSGRDPAHPRCCRRRSSPASPALTFYVKYENLQVTNSFKDRGAFVRLCGPHRRRAPPRRHRDVGRQTTPRRSPIMRSG